MATNNAVSFTRLQDGGVLPSPSPDGERSLSSPTKSVAHISGVRKRAVSRYSSAEVEFEAQFDCTATLGN